jgi:hypothetical protein
MSCHHYDPDFDDSLFPAYANYIYGIDTQVVEDEATPYPSSPQNNPLQPIYYTNSMPSRSALYARAPNASIANWKLNAGFEHAPPVRDLRSPLHDVDFVSLPAPQLVLPDSGLPGTSGRFTLDAQAPAPFSNVDATRQKLLDASPHQWRPAAAATLSSSSPHQFRHNLKQQAEPEDSPERRRMPARQATHPSLLRSSSATDIDSQIGSLPPPPRPNFKLESPSHPYAHAVLPPALASQVPPQRSDNPTSLSAVYVAPHLATDDVSSSNLIRSGQLLTHDRFKSLDASIRLRVDAELTQLWTIAQQHPDLSTRQQGFMRIQALSESVHCRVEEVALEQAQSHTHAQVSTSSLSPAEEIHDQLSVWSDGQEGQAQVPRTPPEQQAHQITPQQSPRFQPQLISRLSTPFDSPARPNFLTAEDRARIDAQVTNFVTNLKFANMTLPDTKARSQQARARANCNPFFSSLNAEGKAYLQQAVQKLRAQHEAWQPHPNPAMQQALYSGAEAVHQPQHSTVPAVQQPGYSSTLPQSPLARVRTSPVPATRQPQQPPLSSGVIQPNHPMSLDSALLAHIHGHFPEFLSTMRCLEDRNSAPADKQRAREFQARFRSGLPVEGHIYIQDILMRGGSSD